LFAVVGGFFVQKTIRPIRAQDISFPGLIPAA
jgi:hypothetical protein